MKSEKASHHHNPRKSQTAFPWDVIPVNGTFFANKYTPEEEQLMIDLIARMEKKLGRKFEMKQVGDYIKIYRTA